MKTNIVYSEKTMNSINSFKLDINSIEKFIINTVKKNKSVLLSQGEICIDEKYRNESCFGTFFVLNLKITQNKFDDYDVYVDSLGKAFAVSEDEQTWCMKFDNDKDGMTVRDLIKMKKEQLNSSSNDKE